MTAHVARQHAGVGVVAAAGAGADEDLDTFAFVEFAHVLGGRGTSGKHATGRDGSR